MINADTGYIVGEHYNVNDPSPILKTTDGGLTSFNSNSGTQNALRAVHFINADTGYISGFGGILLQTTDGTTWDSLYSGTTLNLRSIDFPSPQIGYVCGGSGTVLKTTDAGFTWNPMNVNTDTDLINIRFADDNVGYVVASGSGFDKGSVYKTTDGGATWNSVYSDALNGFLGLAVADANTVYAGGNNDVIVKSIDGGNTWTQVYTGLTGHRIRNGFALSASETYMICDVGDIFHTTDGGATWINETVSFSGLYGIDFPSPGIGYIVGASGTVLKYSPCSVLSIGTITGNTVACEGDSVMFSVTAVAGATNYSWSVPGGSQIIQGNGSNAITVLSGASGTISVNASNLCDTVTATINVTVNPAPAIPTISFVNNILTSTSATSYQWYLNSNVIPGATSQSYTPMQNGFYTVVVTNANGCSATSASFDVLGLSAQEISSSQLQVFPNPLVTSSVFIFSGYPSAAFVRISDVQGKIILETASNANKQLSLERKDFEEGIYFISLLDDQHILISVNKFIVQ